MNSSDQKTIEQMLREMANDAIAKGILELHPDIARGWRDTLIEVLDVYVIAKKGKHKHDPALGQSCETHLAHARDHVIEAYHGEVGDALNGNDDDGKWHGLHAIARLILCSIRANVVNRNSG